MTQNDDSGIKLLIVTPTLGVSRYLGDTIRSVDFLKNKIDLYHVLVAPRGALSKLASSFGAPWRTYVGESRRQGMYAAINEAIDSVGSDWTHFAYLNDDDFYTEELGARLSVNLKKGEWLIGRARYLFPSGFRIGIPRCLSGREVLPLIEAGIAPLSQPACFLPIEIWRRVGKFHSSLRFIGDMEYFYRAVKMGFIPKMDSGYFVFFRVHPGQLSSNVRAMASEREQFLDTTPLTIRNKVSRKLHIWFFRLSNLPVYVNRMFLGMLKSDEMFLGK